MYIIYTQ